MPRMIELELSNVGRHEIEHAELVEIFAQRRGLGGTRRRKPQERFVPVAHWVRMEVCPRQDE